MRHQQGQHDWRCLLHHRGDRQGGHPSQAHRLTRPVCYIAREIRGPWRGQSRRSGRRRLREPSMAAPQSVVALPPSTSRAEAGLAIADFFDARRVPGYRMPCVAAAARVGSSAPRRGASRSCLRAVRLRCEQAGASKQGRRTNEGRAGGPGRSGTRTPRRPAAVGCPPVRPLPHTLRLNPVFPAPETGKRTTAKMHAKRPIFCEPRPHTATTLPPPPSQSRRRAPRRQARTRAAHTRAPPAAPSRRRAAPRRPS